MKPLFLILVLFISITFFGCASGLSYNKVYLSDADMELGTKLIQSAEISSATYREGASGSSEGSVGGGCGCN